MLQTAAWPQENQIVIKHDLSAANALETRSLLGSILTFQSPAVDRTSTNSSSGWLGNPLLLSCWQISAEAHFQFSWQISQGFLPSELSRAKLIHCHIHPCPAQDTGHVFLVPRSTSSLRSKRGLLKSRVTLLHTSKVKLSFWSCPVVGTEKNQRILFRFVYTHAYVCKFTHKHAHAHTWVFVRVLEYSRPNNLSRKQSTTLKLIGLWGNTVQYTEREKNRVTESIFPTDPASLNAFPFTQGTVLYCIWSCWRFLMIFCMTTKAMDEICAPVPQDSWMVQSRPFR